MPNYDAEDGFSVTEGTIRGNVKRIADSGYGRSREDEPSDARITAQLGFMVEQLNVAHKIFSELSSRLEPVLLPEIDEKSSDVASPPRKMASEVSNALDDNNGQITRLQGRMKLLMERIQL